MICPICKQRWASLIRESTYYVGSEKEREKVFESNEIRCCGDPNCLQVVDAMIMNSIESGPFKTKTYDDLVVETKKELAEGKIK